MKHIIIILTAIVFINCNVDKIFAQTDSTTVYSRTTRELESSTIPSDVFKMTNLRKLCITGMDCDYKKTDDKGNDITKCWAIGEIPGQVRNLKHLESLILRVNNIQTLPKEINELKSLRTLDLTDNPGLSNIDNVVGLENLEELVLFGCYLTKLPKDIGRLRNLKYLGLTENDIDSQEKERIKKALPTCDIKF